MNKKKRDIWLLKLIWKILMIIWTSRLLQIVLKRLVYRITLLDLSGIANRLALWIFFRMVNVWVNFILLEVSNRGTLFLRTYLWFVWKGYPISLFMMLIWSREIGHLPLQENWPFAANKSLANELNSATKHLFVADIESPHIHGLLAAGGSPIPL